MAESGQQLMAFPCIQIPKFDGRCSAEDADVRAERIRAGPIPKSWELDLIWN